MVPGLDTRKFKFSEKTMPAQPSFDGIRKLCGSKGVNVSDDVSDVTATSFSTSEDER